MDYQKPCQYSIRLIDRLKSLDTKNVLDFDLINKAIYWARKYHGDQKRQTGEPYYTHPLEVAYMVSDYLFRTDIIITSILHDTIEDTDLTFEIIMEEFGEKIANQVIDLTRIKGNGIKISSTEMVERLFTQNKYELLLVKMFDRIHNMQTLKVKSPQKLKKILDETINTFLLVALYLELSEPYEYLKKLCSNIIFEEDDLNLHLKGTEIFTLPFLNS
ncbi:MAG: hypothetical protein RLZZ418_719 [Pseudomonadota bacterium]|jgi:(p)ppGpp synthase/HD superfamily hydrolase